MEALRGVISKPFGGRERTFKFGMQSNLILADLIDMDRLGLDFTVGVKSMPATFLSGLLAFGPDANGVSKKTDLNDVYDWIVEMPEEDAADVYEAAQTAMGFMTRLTQIAADRRERRQAEKANSKP
ncbi:hypothetical protein GCM10027299_21560 [Larkinella ripae]